MATGGSGTDETLAARQRQRVSNWLLLDGDRRLVAGLTAGVVALVLTTVTVSGLAPLSDLQALYYVFGSLISGNLTVITVVVSISQLLLSREFKAPPKLQSQIEGIIDYRDDVEAAAGQVAPVEPLGFLRLVFENARREAQRMGGLAYSLTDGETQSQLDRVVAEITTQTDRVRSLLDQRQTSTFDVLSVTLTTNYATEINHLRRIEHQHCDQLSEQCGDSIDALVHQLQHIDIARQYFKSVYLQQELASLSRWLFYLGLPSITLLAVALVFMTRSSGSVPPRAAVRLVVPAVVTVGLLPMTLLFAYVLRIATVTQRTAATLPFTTPAQEQ
ncbi:MAG: hypothetical protein ABEI77_02190 [Halorientalis sp.]